MPFHTVLTTRPGQTVGMEMPLMYAAYIAPETLLADPQVFPAVPVPTLGVWSDGDAYLIESQMARSGEHVTAPWRYERMLAASHWLQLDQAEPLNRLMVDFFAA